MKFTNKANANMTSLKGEFAITFAELTEIFGRRFAMMCSFPEIEDCSECTRSHGEC